MRLYQSLPDLTPLEYRALYPSRSYLLLPLLLVILVALYVSGLYTGAVRTGERLAHTNQRLEATLAGYASQKVTLGNLDKRIESTQHIISTLNSVLGRTSHWPYDYSLLYRALAPYTHRVTLSSLSMTPAVAPLYPSGSPLIARFALSGTATTYTALTHFLSSLEDSQRFELLIQNLNVQTSGSYAFTIAVGLVNAPINIPTSHIGAAQ